MAAKKRVRKQPRDVERELGRQLGREPLEIRWQGFRGFADTGWIKLRPLTVIIGPNNTGKTSLMAPLLLLKQTLSSPESGSPLITDGEYVHGGTFSDLLHEHDASREMVFGLRFGHHPGVPKREEPLGSVPPGTLELSFKANESGVPVLTRYAVSDDYGRLFLERTRGSDGHYSVEHLPTRKSDPEQMKLIARSGAERFLFSSRGLMHLALHLDSPGMKVAEDKPIEFSGKARMYLAIVEFTRERVLNWLNCISYLGPLRAAPERSYSSGSDPISNVGVNGRHAPELLERRGSELLPMVNKWMKLLEFGRQIETHRLTKGAFELLVQRDNGVAVNLADTGFGLSQTLPILVQAAAASRNEMLLIEQPEIHLNPRLQYELADLFAETIKKGCFAVVETHSEHLFLRMRRLLAEGTLAHDDVTVLYVEKQGRTSVVREVPIADDGSIPADEWPSGFFEDSLKEALALAMAQAGRAAG